MKSLKELKNTCPTSFEETWNKYPKLRNLMQASILLSFQHIEWVPFSSDEFSEELKLFPFSSNDSKIYTKDLLGDKLRTHVVICKGEIKDLVHYDKSYNEMQDVRGGLELKISAFVANTFKKMSCIITVHSTEDIITGIDIKPDFDYIDSKDSEDLIKNIKRLYNRREWI